MWPFKSKPKSKKIFTLGSIVVQLNKKTNQVMVISKFMIRTTLPVSSITDILWKQKGIFGHCLEIYANGTLVNSVDSMFMANLQDVQECNQYLKAYKKSLELLEAEQIINN